MYNIVSIFLSVTLSRDGDNRSGFHKISFQLVEEAEYVSWVPGFGAESTTTPRTPAESRLGVFCFSLRVPLNLFLFLANSLEFCSLKLKRAPTFQDRWLFA
jgi:hypothetical protein